MKSLVRSLLLPLALLPTVPAGAAAAPRFKTGLYVGTTSQHKPFSFYVKVTECGRKNGLCLYTKTQAYISEPCSNGTETNAYADPGPLIVGKSGIVKETLHLFSTVVTYIKLGHNGTASGHFTATDTEDDCASGTVTFTAKRH